MTSATWRKGTEAARCFIQKMGIAPFLLVAARCLPCPAPGATTLAGIGTLCPVQRFAGLPCPGCGITRSVVCAAHGDWLTAISFHPLGPVVLLYLAWLSLERIPKVRRAVPPFPARGEDTLAGVLIVVVLGIWIGRLAGMLPRP